MGNPPDDGPCEVTITAPDAGWLERFARRLVEDRLAAAAHLDSMHSVYRWTEQVVEANEARVRLHTQRSRFDAISSRVMLEHEFQVSCVIATDIIRGSDAYLAWIEHNST